VTLAERIEALRAAGAVEITILPDGSTKGRWPAKRTVAVDPQQQPPRFIPDPVPPKFGPGWREQLYRDQQKSDVARCICSLPGSGLCPECCNQGSAVTPTGPGPC
jgi:hypothetical protein